MSAPIAADSSAVRRGVGGVDVAEIVAALSLTGYSIAVAAGFARVFSGWDFFDDLVLIAVVGHGASFALRRLRTPIWIAVPLVSGLLVWLIGFVYLQPTYTFGLPTRDTWDRARLEFEVVGEQFPTAVAPVAYIGGWALLAAIGVAIAVVLADAFAFRAFARAESLVPGGVLFVFIAALGSDRSRVALTGALVVAGVLSTVALRAHHAPRPAAVVRPSRQSPSMASSLVLAPIAVLTAAIVAIGAMFVGPRLPGADAEPLYDHTGGGGSGSLTEIVSPLVDIRSRLTNRSPTELFAVTATAPSYWRLSALPEFDGRIWGLSERDLSAAEGELDDTVEGTVQIQQSVEIAALGGPLVPAAANPVAVNGPSDLRWNGDSATLVATDDDLERGDRIEILSSAPRFTVEQLTAATSDDPGDDIYLDLPDGFPGSVRDTTVSVVGDAGSTYEAARRLQDWFQSEFEYSLEVPPGHSTTEIEGFLANRIGYCEQFAGTYAAMMRTIGIPARVAVGFTQGDSADGQRFSVLGRNAHAWPEVWFDGLGWIPFEPTPGRGAPGAEDYTGLPVQQEDSPLDPLPDDTNAGEAAPAPAPPTTLTPPAVPQAQTDPDLGSLVPNIEQSADETVAADEGFSVPWTLIAVLGAIALLAATPTIVRTLRRRPGDDPLAELGVLWARARRSLVDVGVPLSADLTPGEAAAVTTARFPMAARPFTSLATVVDEATFRPADDVDLDRAGPYGATTIEQCGIWTRQIDKAIADSSTPWDRIRRHATRWQ